MGSDVYDPLQAHAYGRDESMGVMGAPFDSPQNRENVDCQRTGNRGEMMLVTEKS